MTGPQSNSSAPALALSIVICTHDRSTQTVKLVTQIASQIQEKRVELIVVDSASDSWHAAQLREAARSWPEAQLIRIEEKGVSLARNVGLRAASGGWVGFIDDDEVPQSNWVERALNVIQRMPANCGACGGVVKLFYGDAQPSAYIGPRWRVFLGEIDRPGEFDQTETPKFGIGHSLVRVSAVEQAGCFDQSLGRFGTSLRSGEEVLLVQQLARLGWRVWHTDAISVYHMIEPARLERSWARRRAYWEGISTERIFRKLKFRTYLSTAFAALTKSIPLMVLLPFSSPSQEVELRLAFNFGVLVEFAGLIRK